MSKHCRLLYAIAFSASLLSFTPLLDAEAQMVRPGELPELDSDTRADVVDSLTAVIDTVYVIADGAELIVAGLRTNLADGLYSELVDPIAFAERLHEDAVGVIAGVRSH